MSEPGSEPSTRREALARERAAAAAAAPALPPAAPPAPSPASAPVVRATAPPRRTRSRALHQVLAGGALLFCLALVVGLSVPANVLTTPDQAAAASEPGTRMITGKQSETVPGDITIPTTTDDYTSSTRAQLLAAKWRGGVGGEFHGPVRWPFPYRVAVMSPFGPRGPVAGCPTCDPFHHGVDLNGGNGNPIFSIMDGTVVQRTGGSWTFGNYAVIVGHYQGHEVKAIYEHMQAGSSELQVGDVVHVGDFVGLVGATGETTAPHLHLELDVDGVQLDPIGWLDANAS
ncbi:M23 family metallopeptidase [Pseudolysinimonas sp.]|uniref:M23 family metallopeptidase n=1 Tax=Pseudolysinimonas sp. TaxID=2680009 RepID=UPI003F820A18